MAVSSREVKIILTFVAAEAERAMQGAMSTFESAMGNIGRASGAAQTGLGLVGKSVEGVGSVLKSLSGVVVAPFTAIKNQFTQLAEHSKWASLLIGGYLTNVATGIFTTAGEFEKLRVAAEYLTGSADAARKFVDQIQRITVDTPFAIDQMSDLGKRILGNTKDIDLSARVLRTLSDAVSATGGGYSELEGSVRAWIQTNSKAKASSEELNRQFANANIPVLRLLAEAIVKDVNNPLREYLTAAGGATGASKTLTKEYEKATKVARDAGIEYDKLRDKLNKAKDKFGESAYQTREATVKLSDFEQKHRDAVSTMTKFQTAQGKSNKAVKEFTLDSVLSQLQDLGDLAIPGTLMSEQMLKAIEANYGGASQVMMRTFAGQLEMLRDNFLLLGASAIGLNKSFEPIEGTIFSLVKNGLMAFNQAVKDNKQSIEDFAKILGTSLPAQLAIIFFFVGLLAPAFLALLAPLISAGLMLSALGVAVGFLIEKFIGLQNLQNFVKSFFGALPGLFTAAKDALSPLVDMLGQQFTDKVLPAWENVKTGIVNTLSSLSQAAQSAADNFVFGDIDTGKSATLLDVWTKLKDVFFQVSDVLGRMFAPVWDALKNSFNDLLPLFSQWGELLKVILPVLGQVALVIGGALVGALVIAIGLWTAFITAMIYVITGVVQVLTGIVQAITGFFQILIGIFTLNGDMIKQGWDTLWNGIVNIFKGAINITVNAVKGFVDSIIAFFTNLYNVLVGNSIIPDMVNGIIGWFGTLDDRVVGIVTSMIETVKNLFGGLVSKAADWGKGIVQGIIGGLRSAVKSAGKAGSYVLGQIGLSMEDLKFAHGGIVPGAIGQPVPIIAHGQERIIPRTGADVNAGNSSPSTVNINFHGNVSLDSSERIDELAQKIGRILGRQNELASYGAGF